MCNLSLPASLLLLLPVYFPDGNSVAVMQENNVATKKAKTDDQEVDQPAKKLRKCKALHEDEDDDGDQEDEDEKNELDDDM
jgi:hypothetical protein